MLEIDMVSKSYRLYFPKMNTVDLKWLLEWTFKERKGALKAHNIHRYPAVFVPELAEKIIQSFSNEDDLILDIFSGSGTALLEAMKLKRCSMGIELNPLAILIAKVKSTYIDNATLTDGVSEWKSAFLSRKFPEHKINNKDFWFHDVTNKSINDAIGAVDVLQNEDVKDFLKICISEIIREISYCVHSGFKLHKDKNKVKNNLSFNKVEFFNKINPVVQRNITAINELKNIYKSKYTPNIYHHDSRIRANKIKNKSVDLILTSPPYGDSRTTVAYGQFSSFSSELLQLNNLYDREVRHLDADLLGGSRKDVDIETLSQKSLTIKNVQEMFLARAILSKDKRNEKRTKDRLRDIISFYNDLDKCIANGAEYLKQNGFFVLVTASRIVHETKLHTDNIIAELGSSYGLKLKNIYYRDIYNKRMPRKVSATNVKGQTTSTMTEESIVILQKT